jgi:hypothetical protein
MAPDKDETVAELVLDMDTDAAELVSVRVELALVLAE